MIIGFCKVTKGNHKVTIFYSVFYGFCMKRLPSYLNLIVPLYKKKNFMVGSI